MVSLPPRYIASSLLFLSLYLSFSICLITYLIIIFFDLSLFSIISSVPFFSLFFFCTSFFTFLPFKFLLCHSGHTFSPPFSVSLSLSLLPLRLMCSFIFHYSPVTRRALRKFSFFLHSVTCSRTFSIFFFSFFLSFFLSFSSLVSVPE